MVINGNIKLAAKYGAVTTVVLNGGERIVGRMMKLFKNAVELKGCRFYGDTMITDVTSRFNFSELKTLTVEI